MDKLIIDLLQRIDRKVESFSEQLTKIEGRLSRLETSKEEGDVRMSLFWEKDWPMIVDELSDMKTDIKDLSTKMVEAEKELFGLKLQVGFWGGLAGLFSAIASLILYVLK